MLFFFACAITAILSHESGHLLAASLLGVKVKKFGICWRGAYIVRESGCPFDNALISLWGPLMNLAFAALFIDVPLLRLANIVYAVVNLLPIPGADGDRILDCVAQL